MIKTFLPLFVILFLSSCLRSDEQYFSDFFGHEPGAEIQDLHVYTEEVGADASFWLAFSCEDSAAHNLVSSLNMDEVKIENHDLSGGLSTGLNTYPTDWWDTSYTHNSNPFFKQDEHKNMYLWHDSENKKVYFVNFDR